MIVLLVWLLSITSLMSDTTSTAAAENGRATTERMRRPERSADAEQPPAEYSAKRKPLQAWRAYGAVELPGGGNNKGRKRPKLGPFEASTKEKAEGKRDQAIDDWLHKKPASQKKVRSVGSSSSSTEQAELEPRPKRAAAQNQPGALKDPNIYGGSTHGQRGAGPGCAPRRSLAPFTCMRTCFLHMSCVPALPPLTQRALLLPNLPCPRPAHHPPPPLRRRGHVQQEPNSEILARFADMLHCDELQPPPDALETNWLKQARIKKQWQTKRIEQLEEQCVLLQGELARALAMNATKDVPS